MLTMRGAVQTFILMLTTYLSCRCGEVVTIVGLAPFSDQYHSVGYHVKPAVDLALKEINEKQLLHNYTLRVAWVDTQCDMAIASQAVFRMVNNRSARSFVFGDYCSSVTKPLAESMRYFQLWQISYADGDPTLSERQTYHNFLRTVPSEMDFNTAISAFLKYNSWSRIATLFQDASTGVSTYAYTHNGLLSLLNRNGIELATTESFASDPAANLDSIIANDGRIIIGYFNHIKAIQVLCKAYHKGMYGYKYVWFLPSSYPDGWWKDTSSTNCSQAQLKKVVDGYFTVQMTTLASDPDRVTISGKTVREYDKLYSQQTHGNSSHMRFHGYAHDGVWVMAKALQQITTSKGIIDWTRLTSDDFMDVLTSIQFSGVTGNVQFINHSRMGELHINQYVDGEMTTVGIYDMMADELSVNDSLLFWHGEKTPPIDRIYRDDDILQPSLPIRITLTCLAVLGQVLAILYLAFNIRCRNTRYIKMSSPNMNNFIIVGCLLIYSSIYILRIDPRAVSERLFQALCITRSWILAIGFSLAFGAMFAKVWRVFNIFNAPHKQKKAIKDEVLYLLVAVLVVIDLIILITWILVDPIQVKMAKLTPKEVEQTLITPVLYTCQSTRMNIWVSIFYAYKGLLLVAGCWFAWQTRHVSIPALNDSKYIGISVYNVVIMCPTAVAISYIMKDEAEYSYLIIGLLIIFSTTITLCLVFAPKVIHLKRGGGNEERRPRVKLKTSQKSSSNHSALARNRSSELEAKITELNQSYENNYFKLQQLDILLSDSALEHVSRDQLTRTLAQISSIGLSPNNAATKTGFGKLLEIPRTGSQLAESLAGDGMITSCSYETKVSGITYVDSDANLKSADQSESRRLLVQRIKELVEHPTFSIKANDVNEGISLEVLLWHHEPNKEISSVTHEEPADSVSHGVEETPSLVQPVVVLKQSGGADSYTTMTRQQLEEILDNEESTYV